jgi:acyl-CoA dehydrogenase
MEYLNDTRETEFFLWELFDVERELLGKPPFDKVDRAACEELLAKARLHAEKLDAVNRAGDRDPARLLEDGTVYVPEAYLPVWEEHLREWFWTRRQSETVMTMEPEVARFPGPVFQMMGEMFLGANPSLMTYAGFTPAAYNLIKVRGTERQKAVFLEPLDRVEWDACFCATEADAGSELTAVVTEATQIDGEIYAVTGEKRYITAGMHPLTANTVYLVLGRVKGQPANSLSMSCFIVPRFWPEDDGSLSPNHVECARVEDKMGLNGMANTHLVFGRGGVTRGFLLGNRPNVALLQLAILMRKARIGTGQMALAAAASAHLHSVRYARQRLQGVPFDQSSNPKASRVPIVAHRDVQRMLLEMRARVEASRAILGLISFRAAKMTLAIGQAGTEAELQRHGRAVLLYAPVAKAYLSEEAWRIVTLAIQVHGARGYMRDLPLERYARDIKILTIWEGTNYIQAQDLVRDKMGFGLQSVVVSEFAEDLRDFLAGAASFPSLAAEFAALDAALATLLATIDAIGRHAEAGRLLLISQYCTRILEMFGEVLSAWMLLKAATIATAKLEQGTDEAPFYRGKIKTARFFIHNILPGVTAKAAVFDSADRSYIEIDSDELGYATAIPAAVDRSAAE